MFTNKLACNLTTIKNKCKNMQNVKWKHLSSTKPKLRTYVKFKENIILKIMLNTALLEEKDH